MSRCICEEAIAKQGPKKRARADGVSVFGGGEGRGGLTVRAVMMR